MRVRWIAASLGTLALAGCAESTDVEWPTLPAGLSAAGFTVIEQVHTTFSSGIQEKRRQVIRDEAAWTAFWDAFVGPVTPRPDPPAVDFGQSMVIVAAMGQRPTGGYAISIEEVFLGDGLVVARVLEQSPGANCLTTQALTAPVTAVIVPRVEGEVRFQEAARAVTCG